MWQAECLLVLISEHEVLLINSGQSELVLTLQLVVVYARVGANAIRTRIGTFLIVSDSLHVQ